MRKYFFCFVILVTCYLTISAQKLNRDSLRIVTLKKKISSLQGKDRIACLNQIAEIYIPYYGGHAGMNKILRADSAGLYASMANAEALKANDKIGLAKSLLNLAGVEIFKKYVRKANRIKDSSAAKTSQQLRHTYISEAIVWGEKLKHNGILGKAYSLKGDLDIEIGNKDAGIDDIKRSIYHAQLAKDYKTEAEGNLSLYYIYSEKGDYGESFDYILNCVKVNRKAIAQNKNDDYINYLFQESLGNLGSFYSSAGDLETALIYFLENYRFGNENHTGWTSEEGLGELYRQLGQYDSALYYLQNVLKQEPSSLWGKIHLGKTYLALKDYDKATKAIQEAIDSIKTSKSLGAGIYMANAFKEMACIYYEKKEYNLALPFALKAAMIFKNYPEWDMYNSELLSGIYRELGNNDSAYYFLKKYITIKDSVFNNQFLMRLHQFKSNAEIEKKESSLALLDQQLKQQAQLKNFLLFGLFALVLIAVFIFRTQLLKRKNDKLANEKTKAELQQKVTDLEMQALRAQMNPHFIFNYLNSINKFIFKNETKEASDYLTRFSRLIRMVLLHSQKKLVPLEDELEMLKLYLDMERLRFKNAFDYHITTTNAIENSSVFIPPLLLQPFCENAIWHGLMHKEGPGHLNIELNEDNGILNCIITDDGVGREKAEEFKSKSAEKEKSMGLKITKERLSLLNQGTTGGTFYEIEDIRNEQGEIAGTRVQLKIKYKETVEESA